MVCRQAITLYDSLGAQWVERQFSQLSGMALLMYDLGCQTLSIRSTNLLLEILLKI